jgi:hypothetical protein
VLIIDTAGRLQNKAELMAELEKIVRVIGKLDPDAPHTVLLTLDATTGQNALSRSRSSAILAGVTGLVMTKLDGTARGGILVAIAPKHKLPVYFIGVGEGRRSGAVRGRKDFASAIAGIVFGVVLLGGLAFGTSLLGYVFNAAFRLDAEGWRKLTLRWGIFFLFLAVLNEVVWRNFSTDVWVSFKVWGTMPITILFTLAQMPLLMKHSLEEKEEQ